MGLPHRRFSVRAAAAAVALLAPVSSLGIAGSAAAETDIPAAADLAVTVAGRDVVSFATKDFQVRVHNNGPEPASGITVTVDASGLDSAVVSYAFLETEACVVDPSGTRVRCAYGS